MNTRARPAVATGVRGGTNAFRSGTGVVRPTVVSPLSHVFAHTRLQGATRAQRLPRDRIDCQRHTGGVGGPIWPPVARE